MEILVFVHQLVELVVEPPVTPKPGLAVVDHVPYVGPFFIHQGGADKDGDIAVRFAGHGIHVGDKGDVEVTDVQDDGGLDPAEQLRHGHPLYVRGGLSEFGGVFLVDKDDAPLAVHHQLFAVVLQFGPYRASFSTAEHAVNQSLRFMPVPPFDSVANSCSDPQNKRRLSR